MKKVKSSNISYIHYEPKTKVLEVGFHQGGKVYHYHEVSEKAYKAFEDAESHGKHFIKHIKDVYVGRPKGKK